MFHLKPGSFSERINELGHIAADLVSTPDALIALWQTVKKDLNFAQIVQKNLKNSQNLLCLVEALISLDLLTMADLRSTLLAGEDEGVSAFWLLVPGADNVSYWDIQFQIFSLVWDKFSNEITLEDLRIADKKTQTTFLWQLAYYVVDGVLAFSEVWMKHRTQLTLKDFLAAPTQGTYQNLSVFWWVARGVSSQPELFLQVWKTFGKDFPVQELGVVAQADDGEGIKGKSALWWLANFGPRDFRPFQVVWFDLKYRLSAIELNVTAELGPEKNASIPWLLANTAIKLPYVSMIIEEILIRIPYVFTTEQMALFYEGRTLRDLFPRLGIAGEKMLALIDARNQLFNSYYFVQTPDDQEFTLDFETLLENGHFATQCGFTSAFYVIGKFLEEKGEAQLALQAYAHLSRRAFEYPLIAEQAAHHYYNQALALSTYTNDVSLSKKAQQQRQEFLRQALKFALAIADQDGRYRIIHKIAHSYTKKNEEKVLAAIDFLSPEWLDGMDAYYQSRNIEKCLDWCFENFNREKDFFETKQQNEILKAKYQKHKQKRKDEEKTYQQLEKQLAEVTRTLEDTHITEEARVSLRGFQVRPLARMQKHKPKSHTQASDASLQWTKKKKSLIKRFF